MPVPKAMLEDLDRAGYRPITINSYQEFIGGCRYVSIETGRGTRLKSVTQFAPNDTRSAWSIWKWENLGAVYQSNKSRSSLAALPLIKGEWFRSVPKKVNGNIYSGTVRSEACVGMPFSQFISACVGGYENPFEIAGAFNQRHPIDTVERAKADLRRVQSELEAREDSVRQEEAFKEVSTLKLVASELDRAGDDRSAKRMRDRAEVMRREVQARLDTEAQSSRRAYNPTKSILEPVVGTPTFEWRGYQNARAQELARRPPDNPAPVIVNKPKLEIAAPSGKRVFLLDDEI